MPTRTYKLYNASSVASADAIASSKVVRKGSISAILFAMSGQAGAAVTGCRQLELSKQSTRQITTNDTPPTVLAEGCIAGSVSGGAVHNMCLIAGLSIPVDVGDTLYMHQVVAGTAFATVSDAICIYVNES